MEAEGSSGPMGAWGPPAVVSPVQSDRQSDMQSASESVTGRRVAAGFIDLLPLVLVSIALSNRVDSDGGFQVRLEGVNFLLMALIGFGYYFVSELLTGTTAGKRLVGITVIDVNGGRPGAVTTLKRTLLRIVDGLPVLYLVGFICMVATPEKQRVGDMVAHTRVVSMRAAAAEAERSGRQRSGGRAALALVIGAAALIGGVVGTAVLASETPPGERLGSFEVDRDMVPRIEEVMTAFEDPTTERIEALFAPGTTDTEEIDQLLSTIDGALGAFTGSYTVVDHRKVRDADLSPLGRHDLMQFQLTAEFDRSTQPVIITFAVLESQLEMVGWNVDG